MVTPFRMTVIRVLVIFETTCGYSWFDEYCIHVREGSLRFIDSEARWFVGFANLKKLKYMKLWGAVRGRNVGGGRECCSASESPVKMWGKWSEIQEAS